MIGSMIGDRDVADTSTSISDEADAQEDVESDAGDVAMRYCALDPSFFRFIAEEKLNKDWPLGRQVLPGCMRS